MTSRPFVSFAQNREDVVLARALRPDERTGTWIDVGASDPIVDSVTAAFSERGWRGVNVEPLPSDFERLVAARPNDVNLCVAAGATPGSAKLFEGPPENRGSSTMVAEIADHYRHLGQEFAAIEVPVLTLAQIVDQHVTAPVDFLKIDVEGFEREVLAGVDWSRIRPRIVVVEATVPNSTEPSHDAWEGILEAAGYCFALFDGLNRFYTRDDEPELLHVVSAPANVLDHYVPFQWSRQIDEATTWAASLEAELAVTASALDRMTTEHAAAWRAARTANDAALVATEQVAVLRADLAAAQLRTAKALADLRWSSRELEALLATRTFRSTARLRDAYTVLRRTLHLS